MKLKLSDAVGIEIFKDDSTDFISLKNYYNWSFLHIFTLTFKLLQYCYQEGNQFWS
jgi:hypothetical protein